MNIISIISKFKTQEQCIKHLEYVRWNNQPICPYCNHNKSSVFKNTRYYTCLKCNNSFSVTVGTLFHDTKISLQKWFMAISLILNARKGISACQLQRDLGIGSYKTAWRMLRLIRKAMEDKNMQGYFTGIIEVDETYVGGKPAKFAKEKSKRGRGTNKEAVIGVMDRSNRKISAVLAKKNCDGKRLSGKQLLEVIESVSIKSNNLQVMTDEFTGYNILKRRGYNHSVINHQKGFVSGTIHTNTIESFWAILKRGVYGIYHQISAKYLQQYINEFCFRYNNRDVGTAFNMIVYKSMLIKSC